MRKLAASIIVLALVAAAAWFGLQAYADHRLHAAIDHYRAKLPPGDSLTYARAKAAPWRLGADFQDTELHRNGVIVRAHDVRLSHAGLHRIGDAELRDVTFQAHGVEGSIASITAHNLSFDPTAEPSGLNQIRVGSSHTLALELHTTTAPGFSLRVADLQNHETPGAPGILLVEGSADQMQLLTPSGPAFSITRLAETGHATLQANRLVDVIADTTAYGLQVPPQSLLGQRLAQIGYTTIQGDGSSHVHFSVTAKDAASHAPLLATLTIDPVVVRLAGVGQISMAMTLDRLPFSKPDAASSQARLVGATYIYSDAGLVARLLQRLADHAGVTPDQVRDRLRHVVQARGDADGNSNSEPELIHFLDDPRQLALALKPSTPVALSDLSALRLQGAAAIPMLGLTLKAD